MKTNLKTIGQSCLLLTMTFFMFACEKKPSHTQAENALKQQLPTFLSLKSSNSEFIPSNKTRGVIQIKAELELNEDLFNGAERALLTPNSYGDQLLNGQIQTLNDLISKCRNKRLSVPDTKTNAYNKAEVDLERALKSSTRTVLTKVTPRNGNFLRRKWRCYRIFLGGCLQA